MDLSFRAIHDVIHPTAAFSRLEVDETDVDVSGEGGAVRDERFSINDRADDGDGEVWSLSQLNPKNRIDSLRPVASPLWRVDGSAGLGTQYYVFPLFLTDPPPMHIDVFIQEGASYPPTLRSLLDLDEAFHTKDATRVRRLGVAQHILRILERQTTHPEGQLHVDAVNELYQHGPLGSFIIIENLTCHIHEATIAISYNYPLENELLSYNELVAMWQLDRSRDVLPPEVDIHRLRLVRQLHDSVCEVYVDDEDGEVGNKGKDSQVRQNTLVALKSLTSGIKYMYQELRALLKDIPPHKHIISRPLHIVTKQCLFGNKTAVVGFTMPYHSAGSLRDILPLLRIHGDLHLRDQLRWSCQLAEAMNHVWYRGSSFYPDLRLDNVVLAGPAPDGDVVLVDFEQRGVWCSFSSPEVDIIENLRLLACDDQDFDFAIPSAVCETYRRKLAECFLAVEVVAEPSASSSVTSASSTTDAKRRKEPWRWTVGRLEEETRYSNPNLGYNVPWICLTRRERESAMVYMLGRVLWCIFEGMSAPHRGAVWQSYPREPELEFPAFQRTPAAVQKLITKCFGTTGGREPSKFVRQTSKLYMRQEGARDDQNFTSDHQDTWSGRFGHTLVSDDLALRASDYWRKQLAEGENWLRERMHKLPREKEAGVRGSDDDNMIKDATDDDDGEGFESSAYGRPTLGQVLRWLQELNNQLGGRP